MSATTMIQMYIHERLHKEMQTHPKKSGKPSRPARGRKIGVMVAMVLSPTTYGLNMSIVNPGRHLPGGKLVGFDKFDPHIATRLAVGKIIAGDPIPYVAIETQTTKRGIHIREQIDRFRAQATKVFKDKSEVVIEHPKQMHKTGDREFLREV